MPDPVPGARLTSIPRDLISRVASGLRGFLQGNPNDQPQHPINAGTSVGPIALQPLPPGQQGAFDYEGRIKREPFFGPGTSLRPVAPREDVLGRIFDYEAGYNTGTQRKQFEGISFEALYALSENSNQVRLAIETVKDQMSGLTWGIKPKMSATDDLRADPDARCQEIETFLQSPDQRHTWDAWQRMLFDQMLVIDAPSVYIRRALNGKPYAFDIVEGSTVRPLLDYLGRTPTPPAVAYQQILKGVPAIDYTANEFVYMPRNPRVGKLYGFSPVEQLVFTINIILRRDTQKLAYFTDGNIPEALISVPEKWTPDQIARFQIMFDAMMADQRNKSRAKFVPGGMAFQPTRSDTTLFGEMDEWFARLVCYCFSLPEQPFVKQNNRATAETANEAALEQGMLPRMIWMKGFVDRLIKLGWGYDDIEFVWDDVEEIDPKEEAARNLAAVQAGLLSIDEVRAEMGKAPTGCNEPFIMGVGPMGLMFVSDLMKAKAAGLLMPQPPPAPVDPNTGLPMAQPGLDPSQEMLPPPGGAAGLDPSMPSQTSGAPPVGGDQDLEQQALAGIPPQLLAAVGLGPAGKTGRKIDVTGGDEFESDPAAPHVGHPQVLRTLRSFERQHASRSRGKRRA